MVKTGEGFYTSLGLPPLPDTFWERSLITRPRDREVVCHASAWDIDNRRRPPHQDVHPDQRRGLLRPSTTSWATTSISAPTTSSTSSSATARNDGFHEAIGDFIALSITPEYLEQIGLIAQSAAGLGRHRPPDEPRAGQDRVPALRPDGRQMALARLPRRRPRRTTTTRRGGICAEAIRASRRRARARPTRSIPARSITSPATRRTCATSCPSSCSSSSRRPRANRPAGKARCIAARSTATRKSARSSPRCWKWAPASPGPTRSKPSPARARWTARRWSILRAADDAG